MNQTQPTEAALAWLKATSRSDVELFCFERGIALTDVKTGCFIDGWQSLAMKVYDNPQEYEVEVEAVEVTGQ